MLGGLSTMDDNYIEEGYHLMTEYITENRIKTKNRKFLRKLDKFYNAYKEKTEPLTVAEEQEYLQLEQEFYNNIVSGEPEDNADKASLEVLNILANAQHEPEDI